MIEIDKPNIDIVELSTQGSRSVGKFVVEPLEKRLRNNSRKRYEKSSSFISSGLCNHFR